MSTKNKREMVVLFKKIKKAFNTISVLVWWGIIYTIVMVVDWLYGRQPLTIITCLPWLAVMILSIYMIYHFSRSIYIDRMEVRFMVSISGFQSSVLNKFGYKNGYPTKQIHPDTGADFITFLLADAFDFSIEDITSGVIDESDRNILGRMCVVYYDIMYNKESLFPDLFSNVAGQNKINTVQLNKYRMLQNEANGILIDTMLEFMCKYNDDFKVLTDREKRKLKSQMYVSLRVREI